MTAEVMAREDARPTTILDELEAGRRRAAAPDPDAPNGWRVDPDVKEAILDLFRSHETSDWAAGPLTFRDRTAVGPRDLTGGPWRIVPGGTAVRRGAYLGRDVVVMPPSYVNVGAWVGDGTMIDSLVLVGSCAQIGERVHVAAGVTIGGVLEPPGARPVIVEDEAFIGAGSALLEGVLVGRGAVIGAGVLLTGTRGCTTWSAVACSRARPTARSSCPRTQWSSRAPAPSKGRSRRGITSRSRPPCSSRIAMRAPARASHWSRRCADG
jgi:2,3,4,5-tetrahydropyridine-2-carboxylate N-succinyltransferase